MGTSFIPFHGWALFFCYVPLWLLALELYSQSANFKKIFFAGWITQFTLTLIGFNWIYYLATEFGQLHWSLAALVHLAFAATMHLYIPLSLVLSIWIFRRFKTTNTAVQLFIMALCLALFERIWPSIFEWNLAYVLLWNKNPLYQWADTVGFWGLSTWILLFQAAIAIVWVTHKTNRQQAYKLITLIAVVFFGLSFSGYLKSHPWSSTNERVKIAITQGNVGNSDKLLSEKKDQYQPYIRSLYTTLTSEHLAQSPADIVIWPETAMPFGLDTHLLKLSEQTALLKTVQSWGIPVVTGAYSIDENKHDHLGYMLTRNAIFYLSPQLGHADKPYFKTNLLVFGEYLPLGEKFPFLYNIFPFVGTYERGPGPITAKVPYATKKEVILGPQVCYDSLYPGFSRGLAKNGAQILFNVTNDSWYGWWSEPYQHQMMTLARAIEVRRPLVRVTNTGISSVILADGTLLQNSPIDQSWTYTYDVPYKAQPGLTLYTRFGHLDWIIWSLALILLIYFGKGIYVRD